jgi:hypothetical protein
MIVGCYSLELYCENYKNGGLDGIHEFEEMPHLFTSERREDCEKQARDIGWMINNKSGVCLCPRCSGKGTPKKYFVGTERFVKQRNE